MRRDLVQITGNKEWRFGLKSRHRDDFVQEAIIHLAETIIGHSSDGSGPGYGEYAIIDMLGPAIDRTRSPFDTMLTEAA